MEVYQIPRILAHSGRSTDHGKPWANAAVLYGREILQ